ncbi:hypothetical protein OG975_45910 [Streptomyces sp. NBC_00203]
MDGVDEDVEILLGRGTDLHCCRCLLGIPAPQLVVSRHNAALTRGQVNRIIRPLPGRQRHVRAVHRRPLTARPPAYPHPDLEPVLADTYGVVIRHEQIIEIFQGHLLEVT